MGKLLLFLISIISFNTGIAQSKLDSSGTNMVDTIRHKWITSDTSYLPIVPTGPILNLPLPNKSPQKPP